MKAYFSTERLPFAVIFVPEGISVEALAGHLKLEKLLIIYDDNKITIDGDTELAFSENVDARMQSYGLEVLCIEKENTDVKGIYNTLLTVTNTNGKPCFIRMKTTIGGS